MASLLGFFTNQHEFQLVVLAAFVCLISAYACIGLLRHTTNRQAKLFSPWTGIAALSVGFGIWSTHFIAMLAFRPGFTLHYDLLLTALSLCIAILVCALGLTFATHAKRTSDHFLGGAVVGLAISSMHYTGIAALIMGGTLGWNAPIVLFSVLAGMGLAGLAFVAAMGRKKADLALAVVLLTAAICVMHFSAMGAADFSRCFPLTPNGDLDSFWLAVALGLAALLVIGAAVASMFLDNADRERTAREDARRLHDATTIAKTERYLETALHSMAQGLSLYDENGVLQLYNQRLVTLLGLEDAGDLRGKTFAEVTRLAVHAAGHRTEDVADVTELAIQEHLALVATGGEIISGFGKDQVFKTSHSPAGNGAWVTTVHDVTERAKNEQAMAHMARHDELTGLPNRGEFATLFDAVLEDAADGKSRFAVIAFDLDRFKEVNDSYGHAVGDAVLQRVAASLADMLDEGEIVARLGGDEFAAIKQFSRTSCLTNFLERLETALNSRLDLGQVQVQLTGSIGVAVFPDDGQNRSTLLSNADMAMYRAKADFEHKICYYQQSMHDESRRRRAMALDLADAVEQDAFHLVYQVQKSVQTGAISGYEVLLRWDRPGEGPVSPAEFIPVAEECGAIFKIGEWVLKQACAEAATWPEQSKIAVNVSALQVTQLDLIDMVRNTLVSTGLSPHRLELEVTETAIIGDKAKALHVLRQIKAMGVSIAIDDFGTGYSSLDTLRSFPFDKIKLDRSFLMEVESDQQSKAILHAIVGLGRGLSVPILAEGVETPDQLEILRQAGCDEMQGYLLGRPGRIDWSDRFSDAPETWSKTG